MENIVTMTKLGMEAIAQLALCYTKEAVESTFERFGISEPKDKLGLLRMCMRVREVYSSVDMLTPEDEYHDELLVFTEGSWRLLA